MNDFLIPASGKHGYENGSHSIGSFNHCSYDDVDIAITLLALKEGEAIDELEALLTRLRSRAAIEADAASARISCV
ncbi:MAG: hypothetical protein CLLPBCKN_006547 [Chroococcidiopsis cubana SAG 39.79]|uniref:Uncharacterized protein n=1 Tax=Chroococcidiopsis cubana SAG 39.79 TaxID=388085 RepID=A0AB37UA95_9CYAN|nr:hypothetical protein [Chroococcidiopsis cubana]MDZ4877112.1 hypothetical protein [Chroococcidiopsis cubana SAG 39.79]PSB60730.1 hypothetical protein C7B79_24625 [Chroococcidiopsis cubana CCALA 043]RUT01430.1 hypothetical protein DSM107010_65240 [Chroococcidiopsis cubana SAG 39.79]